MQYCFMDIYLIHQTVEMIQIQVLSQASIFQKVPNNWFVLGTVPKRSLSFAVNILILITLSKITARKKVTFVIYLIVKCFQLLCVS